MAKSKTSEEVNLAGISVKLKVLRAEYGLTQAQIAAKLGISQQMYSKYENTDMPIDSNTIKKLCEIYGVSADYLLGIESSAAGGKVSQKAFVASDEQLDALAEILMAKMNNKK